jgi:hypothetical protein
VLNKIVPVKKIGETIKTRMAIVGTAGATKIRKNLPIECIGNETTNVIHPEAATFESECLLRSCNWSERPK